jgi:hypothetical protein
VSETEDDSLKVKFPKKPDALLPRESQTMDERRRQLEAYLQSLVRNEELRNHKDLVRQEIIGKYDLSSIQMSFRRNVTPLCHDKKIVSSTKTFLDHAFHS